MKANASLDYFFVVAVFYTAMWNVLNFPAGVLPVTKVTAEDRKSDETNFTPKDFFFKIMKQVSR